MVIVFNTRLLLKDRLEGIGLFTRETLRRIVAGHPEHSFIFLFDRPYDPDFIFAENVTPIVVGPPTRHPLLSLFWFECRIPAILKKYQADLFVSTDGYLSLRTKTPQVVVMHDINFVHRPEDLPWLVARFYNRFFPRYARKAIKIATVSQYSKLDISENLGIDSNKINVVYNGSNPRFKPIPEEEKKAVRAHYTGGRSYFLFVGALHPRKNIIGLLKAYEQYRSESEGGEKLVIVGGRMFKTGAITETLGNMQFKKDVVFTGRVSEEELRKLYAGALALVFVPFFEGFGIPIVEAMASGIPVIASDTTSLPEVGGDAVLYTDPFQVEKISEAMCRISEDELLRKSLIEKGLVWAARFNWDDSARDLWKTIEGALPVK